MLLLFPISNLKMNDELKNILIKVQELYQKYGIKSITMDDVAKHLAISKKTLYQHVCDKSELVSKVIELELDQCYDDILKTIDKNVNAIDAIFLVHNYLRKSLKNFNPSMDYDLQKYYPEIHKRFWKTRKKKLYQAIKINILKGIREGLFREDIDAEVIAKFHVARLEGLFEGSFVTAEEAFSDRFVRETFIYHIRGVANEKGLALYMANYQKFDLIFNNIQNNTKIS